MTKTIIRTLLLLLIESNVTMAAPRPNIILVMADDMGWGDPGYNSMNVTYADGTPHPDQGWISTPTLDTMAANGLRFDRFYSASAVCSPTRASCLLGRNPFRAGVPTANAGRMDFDETPLSEILSNVGYTCGHFGKWHLGSMTTLRSDSNRGGNASVYSAPWHHSYDFCFATESKVPTYHPYRKTVNGLALPTSFADSNFYGTRYWRMPNSWNNTSGEGSAVPVDEVNNASEGDDSKLIIDQTIPFIQDAVEAGKPFFAVVWFHTPHKPAVDPDGSSPVDSPDANGDSIRDMDTALGRLRDELTTLGVRNNTMIWFTSDNGPEDGQDSTNETSTTRSIRSGRLLERKRSLYEGGVRVPGILEWPDVITSGITTNVPAVTSDYYPTILDYLELSVPNQKPLDGISLRPVINGTATVRTKPIGFKFDGDSSWVNQQYKIINDGGGWELYDLINIPAGEEPEQTPLATSSNIGTKPQSTQNIYNTMLSEYTAWNASLSPDSPYIHASQPTVNLTTPSNIVNSPFEVTASFNEPVTELNANEFIVNNGTISELTGSGTTWMVTIIPTVAGPVTITLPSGSAIDTHGNPNGSSNQLDVTSTFPIPLFPTTATSLNILESQTLDSSGNVPGDQDNNVAKFTAGNVNDGIINPYSSSLFVRGSADNALRRVKAHIRFDLSTLKGQQITSATLKFNAHTLNNDSTTNIEVAALAADWETTGNPTPTFDHAIIGNIINGGSIISDLNPTNNTSNYTFDVTTMARNWTDNTWQNHGILIQLSNFVVNNGLGIKTSGDDSIQLEVETRVFKVDSIGSNDNDVILKWSSVPGASYKVQSNDDLVSDWVDVATVTGMAGEITSYTHIEGIVGAPRRFYRIAFLSH